MNIEQIESVIRHALNQLPAFSYLQWLYLTVGIIVTYATLRSIYNVFFHPLAKFPGPKIAALSNVWYGYLWLTGKYPWHVERVLNKYGDVVRIAPNELVFGTPQAYLDIHGSAVRNREVFKKSDFQDIGEKEPGITAERDPDRHREISKQLAPAFSAQACKTQEPILHEHVDEFVRQLEKYGTTAQGINMSDWFDWLSFDLAGKTAYGHDFNHVKDAKSSVFLTTFLAVGPFGVILRVLKRFPTLFPLIVFFVPRSVRKTLPYLLKKNRELVRARVKASSNDCLPDYMTMLLPSRKSEPPPSEDWLLANANVLIVAGFDPITNLLTASLYYVLVDQEKYRRLTDEVRGAFSAYDQLTNRELQGLRYLHGVLEEGLRLHTPAAFGLPRISPGAMVDGRWIPKDTNVQTASYFMTHSERYFHRAREFHPERWLPATHTLHDTRFASDTRSALHPFGIGPRGCIGKAVGYMQARVVLAKLVWYFDSELVNGDKIDWERDNTLNAIWVRPDVWVRFTPSGGKT